MISSMSQSGTFIPQEVLQTNLKEKDIKKIQKEIHNEIKEEIKEKKKDLMLKKKEEIKRNLRSRIEDLILEGDGVFSKEINRKNLQSA